MNIVSVNLLPYWPSGRDHQLLGHNGDGAEEAWQKETGQNYYQLSNSERKEVEKQLDEWMLLFQIGSDDEAGMMFSDAGMLFFLIRRNDLAALRFDRVFVTMICG